MEVPSMFNCSNDMALAANVRQYVPPKRIRQMEADLADLARVWEDTHMAGPWGWSLATKQRYRQMGVAEEALPTDEWLEEVRRLSSREFAWFYLKQLLGTLKDVNLLGWEMKFWNKMPAAWNDDVELNAGTGREASVKKSYPRGAQCRSRGVRHAVAEGCASEKKEQEREMHDALSIFKSPWSSSGRGVFVGNWNDARTQAKVQGFLSSQGGFVVDRFYEDKVLDFAMEFFVHKDHTAEFLGYSVFHAGEHGAYGYNYVESQEELLRRIDVDAALLHRLIAYHKEHLAQTAYHGPVGIDMLKTADGSIHPCLEINLRLNMGILALLLHEQYGSGATVALTPVREHGFQALVEDGRLMILSEK